MKKAEWKKPEWLTEKVAHGLCSNVRALIFNDGLTAFLSADVMVAAETGRAEVVVERLDTGEPVFRITTKKEMQKWVQLFDKTLHEWKDAANRQTMLALKGGKQ